MSGLRNELTDGEICFYCKRQAQTIIDDCRKAYDGVFYPSQTTQTAKRSSNVIDNRQI